MILRLTTSLLIAATVLSTAALSARADDARPISQESPTQWRASKLAGVLIYGPDKRSVGKISDVLVSKDGKAEYVVVGVGGFLGIGEKDVAIPYDHVTFIDQPIVPPSNPAGFDNAKGGTAADGGMAPATTSSGAGGVPTSAALGVQPPSDTGSAIAHSTAYPDHAMIDMTADQLKNAPAFKFAS